MVLTSVAAGSIFYLIFTLFRSNKVSRWLALLFLEIAALLFLLSYFVFDSFKVFNDIQTIAEGAGGIANEFGSAVWSVILKGYGIILLYEIPVILFILFFCVFHILHLDQAKRRTRWILLLVFLVFEASGILLMIRNDNYARRLTRNYNFNLVTQSFSLQTAYKTDALYLVFGNPFRSSFYSGYQYLDDSSSDGITYGIQELDLTFPETTNKKIKKMNDYVASLTPSSRNEYTGIFKGKNIIFISAESLSSEVIRPDLTPTLYKLKTEGIQFENYYQPYYNSSTATGEFANLMGLVPTSGMRSFTSTIGKELYFTIGNETLRQGYHNIAYHNGTVEYYKRYLTHPNFGYSDFIAQGNGMEEGLSDTWPESDLEMFQYSLPQYIDQEPFCIYYMTLTAHFPYYKDLSVMTDQYGSLVENMGYSDVLEAYFTDMIDFDRGLAYLLDELENKKIADDTVLVISPDHFPYGLTKSDSYGTDKDYLPELFGFDPANEIERDHNSLIIWSKSLEKKAPIIVS
ncbi:MAG: LTA synthase family protein, partial [Lachnospiraceae bacterium]|nr:LTA synthase family protein [Lachnospiraceae bacterium]